MKKLFIIMFLVLSISLTVEWGVCQSQFQFAFGGSGEHYANSIIQTSDSGYVVAGSTNSFGAGLADVYIVKVDVSGTLQWSKTIGGINNDRANSIIQTSDGGYVVAGRTNSFGAGLSDNDMYIIKLDGSGTLQWSKTIGGTSHDVANSIIQTSDSGYVVAGSTLSFGAGQYDMYIIKLDRSGTLQWSKTIGGTGNDVANSIIQTSDGGYIVAGNTSSFGTASSYFVKLDESGTLQWSKTIGGSSANSIIQTSDGGYVVAGSTTSFGAGSSDIYIAKLDGNGTLQLSKTIGGTSGEIAYSIIQTTDGGYAIAGRTFSFGAGSWDIFLIKLDGNITFQWGKTIGGVDYEIGNSCIQTSDGGYAVAGFTRSFGAGYSNMYIVKLDENGNTCGNSNPFTPQIGTGGTVDSPSSIVSQPASVVNTPTPTISSGGSYTGLCLTGIQINSNGIPSDFKLEQNYPNPFNPTTLIRYSIRENDIVSLKVYNALGSEVAALINEHQNAGTYEVEWDAGSFPSGIYFYTLQAENFTVTKKMVLTK